MYPPIEPFDSGLLPRPDGAQIYWEESGDPDGLPGLYLHGGPGGELGAGGYRRRFDPDRYRIIGLISAAAAVLSRWPAIIPRPWPATPPRH